MLLSMVMVGKSVPSGDVMLRYSYSMGVSFLFQCQGVLYTHAAWFVCPQFGANSGADVLLTGLTQVNQHISKYLKRGKRRKRLMKIKKTRGVNFEEFDKRERSEGKRKGRKGPMKKERKT